MKCITPENLALLATQIAIELSKGKNLAELNLLRNLANQVSAVLNTMIAQKIEFEKEKNNSFSSKK